MITNCNNTKCEQQDSCYRYSENSENKFNSENCKHFWNINHKPKKQIRP